MNEYKRTLKLVARINVIRAQTGLKLVACGTSYMGSKKSDYSTTYYQLMLNGFEKGGILYSLSDNQVDAIRNLITTLEMALEI